MRRKLQDLKLLSFNLLAPCYFRHGGRLEATDAQQYMGRLGALVSPLKAEQCNVLCLQELWFDDAYMRSFQSHFPQYSCYASKRPGLKEDGLAVFIDHTKLAIHNFQQLDFDKAGERVAMLLHLSFRADAFPFHTHSFMERSFLVVNTHLTFPHSDINRIMRMSQIETMLNAVVDYQRKENLELCPVIMCGDFNDIYDPVHDRVIDHGFQSVFSEVGVDFIFCHNPDPSGMKQLQAPPLDHEKRLVFTPTSCDLLPRALPDTTRLKRPEFISSRMPWEDLQLDVERSVPEMVDLWRLVSDHRPLVASFDVDTNSLS